MSNLALWYLQSISDQIGTYKDYLMMILRNCESCTYEFGNSQINDVKTQFDHITMIYRTKIADFPSSDRVEFRSKSFKPRANFAAQNLTKRSFLIK